MVSKTALSGAAAGPADEPVQGAIRTALIVDDSRAQRRILRASLSRWGYRMFEAASGAEALKIARREAVDLVLSDWMMPGMTGPEFCRAFRALPGDGYGYFILLTSKSEKDEVARGLDAGADDFLAKPVNAGELRARIAAGERILRMQHELTEKNRMIGSALAEIRGLYDAIDRDLIQARKIQESLVPDRSCCYGASRVSMLIKPCGHVGGDLVGTFSPGPGRVGFYNIDVSGHGITSALMTARLAGYLSSQFPDQNIALKRLADRSYVLRPPVEVARMLNSRLLSTGGVEDYFTMIYADADLTTGSVRLVQAGHPYPIVQRADGSVEFIGRPGLPIGLIAGAEHDAIEITLTPGDRMLIYSDGFTESECSDGRMLDNDGMADLLTQCTGRGGPEMLDDLFWMLTARRRDAQLDDDVSALLFEYGGP